MSASARRKDAARRVPAVHCPRAECRSTKVRIRFTRWSDSRQVIVRHYLCAICRRRFRMRQPREEFDGFDRPAA